ncbi:MAG TPA: adenylate/guanylate cyclase domain-containing protein [Nevskiaceae bacterium]|nr:adenylate/guanylate cyclase domain-containing protein [Nevskiaceae bacterium]
MNDLVPHALVSLVALGMGLAFLSADRESRTSRALAAGLAFIGLSIYLNVAFIRDLSHPPALSRWLALPEVFSMILILEWLLRVRQTLPAGDYNTRFGDRVLRVGQGAGLLYMVFALVWPEIRTGQFLRAGEDPHFYTRPGFWMFMGPVLVATLAGLVGILLLLNRKPDKAERIRVLAMAAAVPFFTASFVLPLSESAIVVVIGEIIFFVGAVHYHVLQGQRGQFMSRFLSPQVAQLVNERGLKTAMQENFLEITVVCCDLRGFTSYAQAHPSSRVLAVLREYYDGVGQIVADFGGTIKDFAGDGILILVGAPLPVEHHARCGIEMARRIRAFCIEMTRRWSSEGNTLGIGIGVASGKVTVGVIGSASRLEYTAVGSAVNLASRLCEQAQHCEILIDRRTVELAGEDGLESRATLAVKGFAEPVPSYALPG